MREERAVMNVRASTKADIVEFMHEHRLSSQDATLRFLLTYHADQNGMHSNNTTNGGKADV